MTGPSEHADRPPEDVFAALGSELRINILYTLWKAHDPPGATALSFAQLRERTEMRDSGNFNYHLKKLVGTFIEQTEDGYELREAGQIAIRSVLAGTHTEDATIDFVAIDEDCPLCEKTLLFGYYDGAVRIKCPDCVGFFPCGERPQGTISVWPLSPVGVRHRTLEEIFELALTRFVLNVWSMIRGICPACSGIPKRSIHICENHTPDKNGICADCGNPTQTGTIYTCTNCKYHVEIGPWAHALFHPAVIAFLYEHGVDEQLTSRAYNERVMQCGEEILSLDPLRIEVTVPAEDDELRITFDENMSAINIGD